MKRRKTACTVRRVQYFIVDWCARSTVTKNTTKFYIIKTLYHEFCNKITWKHFYMNMFRYHSVFRITGAWNITWSIKSQMRVMLYGWRAFYDLHTRPPAIPLSLKTRQAKMIRTIWNKDCKTASLFNKILTNCRNSAKVPTYQWEKLFKLVEGK